MQNENKEIKTVHERDLDNLLIKLSKKDEFDAGNIKCKFCKVVITKENLYSLFAESGTVNFICDKPECIANFMSHTNKKRKSNIE